MNDLVSAIGTKRTYRVALHMSAFDPKREPNATPNDLLEPSLARAMIMSLQLLI